MTQGVMFRNAASSRAILPVVAAAILAASCGAEPGGRSEVPRPPVDVSVQAARVAPVAGSFDVGGVVKARTTATLVSRILADIQDVLAKPGDRVRAGQVLLRLDGRELQAHRARAQAAVASAEQRARAAASARQAAEAALTLAAATHRRIAELRAKNSATPGELDQAVSALRAAESQAAAAQAGIHEAEAGVEAAREALRAATISASYAVISAPFDGVVTEKHVEPGNMAAPGSPLLTVEDSSAFRLEVRVDESRAASVAQGADVPVQIDAVAAASAGPGAPLTGVVSEVARALEAGSHAFLVKIDLPRGVALRSGMFGRARFAGPPRQVVQVPLSAVVRHGQVTSVFVAGTGNRARLRLVQVGPVVDGLAEIVAGLDAGEAVVIRPPASLVDGAPIRPSAQAGAGGADSLEDRR